DRARPRLAAGPAGTWTVGTAALAVPAWSGGAQLARERERHVLLHRLDLFYLAEPVPGELVQHRGHQFLGHRGPAGHADRGHALQPALVDFPGVIDQVGGRGAVVPGH